MPLDLHLNKRFPLHQENGSFTFFLLIMLFHTFQEKSRKSTKKPSPLLARVLSGLIKKVDRLSKVFWFKKYMHIVESTAKKSQVEVKMESKTKVPLFTRITGLNHVHQTYECHNKTLSLSPCPTHSECVPAVQGSMGGAQ